MCSKEVPSVDAQMKKSGKQNETKMLSIYLLVQEKMPPKSSFGSAHAPKPPQKMIHFGTRARDPKQKGKHEFQHELV